MAEKVPYHIGIIIDGNRRWAKGKGLSTFAGHIEGLKRVKEFCRWCKDWGIKILTIYGFSTENWQRSEEEVKFLMKLIEQGLRENMAEVHREGYKIQVIGQRERLPESLQEAIRKTEELTKNNKEGVLNLAISYGGRAEIVEAVRKIKRQKISPEEITEETINKNLWTAGLPDPDLIIRTGGERRLSGFLTWQSSYSELIFLDIYWPDFTKEHLAMALNEYTKRERRFGK